MSLISRNISLYTYNTFGIDVEARFFSTFSDLDELAEVLASREAQGEKMILGGGSNVLFTRNYDGLILRNEIAGMEIIREEGDRVWVKSGAGVVWHDFVVWCIQHGFAGVENLSLIPGSVGAGPMQNIGAYGVELKEVFDSLEAYHILSRELHTFTASQCEFGYRESVFKRKLKGQYIIASVTFCLSKTPDFKTSYGAIEQELERMGVGVLSLRCVSQAVINIRRSKLPDPRYIGNAGSFFKNPVISEELFQQIAEEYPEAPSYPVGDATVKVPAGWLIERASWKGQKFGNYGVHDRQALVLVNYGGAQGHELLELSDRIIQDIQNKFGIALEREVNIV